MTQDAPLDQTALEAAIAWAQEGTRDDTLSALTLDEHGALIERAIGIFLDALSRRVPASGGEADTDPADNWEEWCRAWHGAVDAAALILGLPVGMGAAEFVEAVRTLAASPRVAAPEGWRRAFLAYVEPEDAFTQLAIALCRADGNNPDATVSVDGGPMQRHWHYYAEEARTMLFAAAPSIPEGKAEPVVTDAMVEAAEAAVYPRHERGFLVKPLIDPIDMRAALEAALSTPVQP